LIPSRTGTGDISDLLWNNKPASALNLVPSRTPCREVRRVSRFHSGCYGRLIWKNKLNPSWTWSMNPTSNGSQRRVDWFLQMRRAFEFTRWSWRSPLPGTPAVYVLDRQTYQGVPEIVDCAVEDRDRETWNSKVCTRTLDTRFIQVGGSSMMLCAWSWVVQMSG
jgi:hypothetical protein